VVTPQTKSFILQKTHLWPKQLSEHGLEPGQLHISDEVLLRVINFYTREAGVRELQRKNRNTLPCVYRKVLKPDVQLPIEIDAKFIEEALGSERFVHEMAERLTPPGVVTGLAWTPMGEKFYLLNQHSCRALEILR